MSTAITTHELSTLTSMPKIFATRHDVPNNAVSSSHPGQRRTIGADGGLGGQVLPGGRGPVDGLVCGFGPAEGAHHGGRPGERLPADMPAVAVKFFDEHPDHLPAGLRSLEGDHHVGEPGRQVVLLLLGKGSRGERDMDQWHDVLLCRRVIPVPASRVVPRAAQGLACFWTKARAVSATSRQPWSMVRECPRPGILTISVMPGLRFCLL